MTEPDTTSRPQFRLLTLLVGMTVVAVWCSVFSIVPHIAIATLGLMLPVVFTMLLAKNWKEVKRSDARRPERVLLVLLCILTASSWAFAYVVSIGPSVGLATYAGIDMRYIEIIYSPISWLFSVPLLTEPLLEYCRMWTFR